jgi:CRP-like cAMP-binding protein
VRKLEKKKQHRKASSAKPSAKRVRAPPPTPFRTRALQRVARSAEHINLPRGRVLIQAGDPASAIYVVLSGCIKLALPRRGSEPQTVVALSRAGDMFDASAVFLDQPHLVSATAVKKSRVARVPKPEMLRAVEGDPALAHEVTRELSHNVHRLLAQVRGTAVAGTGAYKLVNFLLGELPSRLGAGPATITLPASKRAIAARLQLTPEHLSRVLGRLSALGLLSVDGPHITIRDVNALRTYPQGGRRASRETRADRRVSRARLRRGGRHKAL